MKHVSLRPNLKKYALVRLAVRLYGGVEYHFSVNDEVSSILSTWNNISALPVNANKIHKNGHLFVEHALSQRSIKCLVETKFDDRNQVKSFQLLLRSKMQHKMYINDANSAVLHPIQNCSGGVMKILRSDFPDYDRAEEITGWSIGNHLLVLRIFIMHQCIFL